MQILLLPLFPSSRFCKLKNSRIEQITLSDIEEQIHNHALILVRVIKSYAPKLVPMVYYRVNSQVQMVYSLSKTKDTIKNA